LRTYPALTIRHAVSTPAAVDLVAAALDDFGLTALEETEAGTALRAFFAESSERDAAVTELRQRYPSAVIEAADVSDEDWAARSQASLTAIRAGALTIAPPWDVPADRSGVIVILPSMGFGTGHHATTRLCLTALQNVNVHGSTVVDVGTGSGVLALAAAKLGASRVLAIDNDPDAISNALENRDLNDLDVEFRCEGIEDAQASGPFDVLLANLTGGVLIKYARALQKLTRPGGQLILSGLREEEGPDVLRAFEADLATRQIEDGWVALVLTQRGP
jgi:ribosomal protein L11 methyltransferase